MKQPARRNQPTKEEQLDRLIAQFLSSCDAGQELDRKRLIAENPQEGAELEEFFADHDFMSRLSTDLS